jgi:hypothetical protein
MCVVCGYTYNEVYEDLCFDNDGGYRPANFYDIARRQSNKLWAYMTYARNSADKKLQRALNTQKVSESVV